MSAPADDATQPKTPTPADIEAMIEVFQTSGWDELHIEMAGFELFLSNDPQARRPAANPAAAAAAALPVAPMPAAAASRAAAPLAVAPGLAPSPDAGAVPAHWVAVTAPNLGTFYCAPKPGAPPYVEVGQAVTADSELCLIEVMKLFTALRSGVAGAVRRICVADGALVEHGQVLFWIEP
jgi:acetyl-CoA carboxylase biotin carboxyl carrier protein